MNNESRHSDLDAPPSMVLDGVLETETVLADDYPVHWGYLYVCDAWVRVSPIGGGRTVADLKRELNVKEVRSCDIASRHLWG